MNVLAEGADHRRNAILARAFVRGFRLPHTDVWGIRHKMQKCQRHGILFSAVDGRFPVQGEVMPMTTYEKAALALAFLQLLAALLALLK